ncbi:MAG: hypothetical protein II885_04960 [Oscillospiraceae bacterium]|nr:hypothetical protein [Oscillospiraceae bacterium]
MKKTVGVVLALLLLLSFAAPAFAEVEDTTGGVWYAEFSGYSLSIPEAYRAAAGFLHFFDFGGGLEFEGTGILFSRIYYTGMPEEERLEAVDEIDMAFLMEDWDLVGELEMEFEKKQLDMFSIYVTASPWGSEELRTFLREKAVTEAKGRGNEAEADYYTRAWDSMNIREIGEKDGFRYYLTGFTPEILQERYEETLEESYLTECFSLLEQPELIVDNLTLTTPTDKGTIYVDPSDDVQIERLF